MSRKTPLEWKKYFESEQFESEYYYGGNDLGCTLLENETRFRIWAPTAEKVTLNLYKSGNFETEDKIGELELQKAEKGTWTAVADSRLTDTYYTYTVTANGENHETQDVYSRACGVNGRRSMTVDLNSTHPQGWQEDNYRYDSSCLPVIYELHIRDLGTDESSGITNVGKYLSLTEHGTTTESGIATGVDHIKDLGITHLHILPMYDYGSVDETKDGQFNWGYDPVNYNVPEGSYSSDPYNGAVRVNEVKQMVQSLHNDNISVVMDVVYNHVQSADNFCFNLIVPQYFSRVDAATGTYSSGSGCGNATASERAMVKKYIVDSVTYWADEYHIDGFRFDLVGLIDTETINEVMEEVHKTHPDVIFYGEGWTLSTTLTKEGYTLTTQTNSTEVPGFAFFSDTIRDALKGNVFDNKALGYVSGAENRANVIKSSFQGLSFPWCTTPAQSVNYASCHDNMTLFDRLQSSRPDASTEDLVKMNNLTAAIYITAEGIPFMQAGEEMLRTKVKEDGTFDENSYSSSDEINSLKWDSLDDANYMSTYEYYKGLIAFRKAHAALRMTTAEDVKNNITAMEGLDDNVLAFQINGGVNGETADSIFIFFNPNTESTDVALPAGNWNVYVKDDKAGTEVLESVETTATVSPISAMILVQESADNASSTNDTSDANNTAEVVDGEAPASTSSNVTVVVVAVIAVVLVAGVAVFFVKKKKKK